MEWIRIATLIGIALLVAAPFVAHIRVALLVTGYGIIMTGLLAAIYQGVMPESGFVLPALLVNTVAVFTAGMWFLAQKKKAKNAIAPLAVVFLALSLVFTVVNVEIAPQLEVDWYAFLGWDDGEVQPGGDLVVHFIDVGQGDAILAQTAERNVLIDGGTRGAGQTVADYLRSLGISSLDLVIATHPHEDHIGGLLTVLSEFEVAEVMDPGAVHTTVTFEQYLDLIDEKNITFTIARAGMIRDLGSGIRLTILHPTDPLSQGLNDCSIVARLTGAGVNFMFTGDIEAYYERKVVGREKDLSAHVLKIAHHGSRSSTSKEFLAAVNPEYAVIMTGEGNRYNHPHSEVLQRLKSAGVTLFRTDMHGTVVMTVTDGVLHISTEHQPSGELFAPGDK